MRIALLLPILILAGCAASGDDRRSPAATSNPTASESSMAGESPAPSSEQPAAGEVELAGRLGTEAIEGGCPYLEAANGTRYEVIYPPGWTVDGATATLRDPNGAVTATAGQVVTVRGHEAPDMVSICQIGPIFEASEVVSVE